MCTFDHVGIYVTSVPCVHLNHVGIYVTSVQCVHLDHVGIYVVSVPCVHLIMLVFMYINTSVHVYILSC